MIYSFNIRNEFNEEKHFFLSADSFNQLCHKVRFMYGTDKDNIELLAEYEETPDWGYKLVKSYINEEQTSEYNKDTINKAKKLMATQSRMSEPWKSDYISRHKVKEVPIETEKDLYPLIEQYKLVKVKWDLGEKRGQHKYYALVK